jgi:hypothetical protein
MTSPGCTCPTWMPNGTSSPRIASVKPCVRQSKHRQQARSVASWCSASTSNIGADGNHILQRKLKITRQVQLLSIKNHKGPGRRLTMSAYLLAVKADRCFMGTRPLKLLTCGQGVGCTDL